MFGCYRRGDANDPDTYVAAVAMVLAHYSVDIITAVTDPYRGLPGKKSDHGWSGLPDVAEVRAACEAEAVAIETRKRLQAIPRPNFQRLEGPREKKNRGVLLVRADRPRYQEMVDRALTADPLDYRYEGADIWVPISWWDSAAPARSAPRRFNAEDLQRIYARNDPATQEPAS